MIEGHETEEEIKEKTEEVYNEFWKDIIENKDGTINKEQLKKELADFSVMIEEVPKVYSEITGGKLSKPLYSATTILSEFNELHLDKSITQEDLNNMIKEFKLNMIEAKDLNYKFENKDEVIQIFIENIKSYLEIE